jgi:hypothetical protein
MNGDVEAGSIVDEQWLLDLERKKFHGTAGDGQDQGESGIYVEEWEAVTELIMELDLPPYNLTLVSAFRGDQLYG